MPNIPQYNAPATTLHTSNEGMSAYETAGRRIGPLLNQAAGDAKEEGRLQAEQIKEQRWPLDFLALGKKPGGVGFKVIGDINKPWGQKYTDLGQIGAGAANIGAVADEVLKSNPEIPNQYDVGGGDDGLGVLKSGTGDPNAGAAAAANAWYFGSAKPKAEPGAQGGLSYTPAPEEGVISRIGRAIGAITNGQVSGGSTDNYGGPS